MKAKFVLLLLLNAIASFSFAAEEKKVRNEVKVLDEVKARDYLAPSEKYVRVTEAQSGHKYYIKTFGDHFVKSAESKNAFQRLPLAPLGTNIDTKLSNLESAQFEFVLTESGKWNIRTNGREYLCAVGDETNSDGSRPVRLASVPKEWESFDLVQTSDGKFALRSVHDDYYLRANLHATGMFLDLKSGLSGWETFELVEVPPRNTRVLAMDLPGLHIEAGTFARQGPRGTMEDDQAIGILPETFFALVADGHGGTKTSELLAANFHEDLKHAVQSGLSEESLIAATLAADKSILNKSDDSGTTMIAVLIQGRDLWAVNVGDSRAVLARKDGIAWRNGVITVPLSEDQKPGRASEGARIRASKGGATVRGRYLMHPDREVGGLAVARALGDKPYKIYKGAQIDTGLIATPEVKHVTLEGTEEFIILACDGVWDVFREWEATAFVHSCLNAGETPKEAAASLVNQALARGSRDNVTATIVRLKHR